MGTLWCRDMPRVTVPQTKTAKRVTFIYPYYENPQFLAEQRATWCAYPEFLLRQVDFIVVDDGSPEHPLEAELRHDSAPGRLRAFRVGVDCRWNWLAARNIGAHHASDGWLLLTDMDHVVPAETLAAVLYGSHDPGTIYGFDRAEHTGAAIQPHPNSWLMTREMFWRVGGYDERLSGHYGTDGDWRRRCAATAKMAILTDRLVRHEFVADSSTTRYKRKQPEDAGVRRIIAARGKRWRPKVLSFPYGEVTC